MFLKERIRGTTRIWFFILLSLVLLAGCRGDSKSPPAGKTPEAKTEAAVEPTERQNGLPASPEAAARQMVEGLKQNRPVVVWQAMPRRFQDDINGLVRDFARKMDPALWQKSFATWEKLARLLARKKTEILSQPQFENLSPEDRRRLEQHWDGLVELLTILVHSELADLTELQSFDMARFLEKTGGRWLTQLGILSESLGQDSLSGMLAGLVPKTISQTEDKAILGWMVEGSSEPVSRFSMIKVEGRWIPAGWELAWEQVRTWRAQLRQMPAEAFTQQSREKIQTLARVERVIDQLLATQTAEEFHQTLTQELGEPALSELASVVRMLGGAGAVPETETPPLAEAVPKSAGDASTVTLIIDGATKAEDEDRIFEVLQSAVPGDVDVQFHRTPTGRKVIVGPVGNLDDFGKRLTFGTITKTNAGERTIHLDMKR